MTSRYDTTGNVEAQFQPGSDGRVLVNKLGVSDLDEMDDIELDYTTWDKCRNEYFSAIRAGMSDYEPMKGLVRRVLRETVASADG